MKFGDNDTLSALVASLAGADLLILLSTAPGLVDRKGTGQVIPVVEKITPQIEALAGGTESATAVGGMISKLAAVKIAARSGCGVIIASGEDAAILPRLLAGAGPRHLFRPGKNPARLPQALARLVPATRRQRPRGRRRRARPARTRAAASSPRGVTAVEGEFAAGDVVAILGPGGAPIARGIAQFSATEARAIAGQDSAAIAQKFPGRKKLELVHRDSLVVL